MSDSFRDKLSMLDTYGGRIPIYPAEVRGVWRSRRNVVQAILLIIFLALPFITINGAPAVLFGLEDHRLSLFGLKFWAHDGPLFFFILGLFALLLAMTTALLGRAWCGWACPQTVFLDGVIRKIESLVEGNHLQRRSLAAAPWSAEKIFKKIIKWFLFVTFSFVITHSFLAYFFGKERVFEMLTHSPKENWSTFLFICFVNALVLFDMTWFREQFCLIVCPYGRIQSVLMDPQTVTVQYDAERGEPRKNKELAPNQKRGDCVGCSRCVQVCPTGIDIRNGLQLECISCTACIDACDEIMTKVAKPKGLIRYKSSTSAPVNFFRPRVLLYMLLFTALLIGATISIGTRKSLEVTLLRSLDTPYLIQEAADGQKTILNSYRLHLHNQSGSNMQVQVSLLDNPALPLAKLKVPESMLNFKDQEFRMIPFVVEVPAVEFKQTNKVKIQVKVQEQILEAEFVGPQP